MASITSSKRKKPVKTVTKAEKPNIIFQVGLFLFSLGILIFILTFYRILWQETKYSLSSLVKINRNASIKPVDEEFGIVIPKIKANAKVIKDVDPYDSKAYQWALTKGVAHAKGTAFPGHAGNSFIFAHSSVDWYIANQYNSVFYLLHKLEKGDKIELYYKKTKYIYEVMEKKYVEASDVSYLNPNYSLLTTNSSLLTLMTCWPPGTTIKRLIIQAKIIN